MGADYINKFEACVYLFLPMWPRSSKTGNTILLRHFCRNARIVLGYYIYKNIAGGF